MAGACATTCASDADCADGNYCEGAACAPKKAAGVACTEDRSCTSAHCADGVCCDKACAGACESCAQTGKTGTCSPAPDGPTPAGHPTCTPYLCKVGACGAACTTDAECSKGNVCKGGKCEADVAKCSPDKLSSTPPGGGAPKSCNGYLCKPNGDCAIACTSSSDCAPGFLCDAAQCRQPTPPAATEEAGGCAITPAAGGNAALLFLGVALVRRRKTRR